MSLYLYNITLQKPGSVSYAITGKFSSHQENDIVVARGKSLELKRLVDDTIHVIHSVDVFGVIRSLSLLRIEGFDQDYIVVGSDSGKLTIISYNDQRNSFDLTESVAFGPSGCRRTVPGQYTSTDPKGRAIAVSAVEETILFYIVSHTKTKISLSEPLKINEPRQIIFDLIGIDSDHENPIFATVELSYNQGEEYGRKKLVIYEVDVMNNEVLKKSSEVIDQNAYKLISVPSEYGVSGGLFILAKDTIYYKNISKPLEDEVKFTLPKRQHVFSTHYNGGKDDGVYFIAHTFHTEPNFLLIQTEFGDLFKIELGDLQQDSAKIEAKYFDTTAPASFLTIMESKYLYSASETGNHYLYSIHSHGEDNEDVTFSNNENVDQTVYFNPRPLKNMTMEDEILSMAPIIDVKVENVLKDDSSQLLCLCGQGPRSTLRVLRHGLSATEIVQYPLQNQPLNVWSVKQTPDDEYDKYIILSFAESTSVLHIDEGVNQLTENDESFKLFVTDASTIASGNFGDGFVQIHANGIQYVRDDQVTTWNPSDENQITSAALNERQIVIALNGGEIHSFEADKNNNNLNHVYNIELSNKEIHAISIPQLKGEKSNYFAFADSDSKLRVCNLIRSENLQVITVQQLPAKPSSLAFVSLQSSGVIQNYLVAGTINGILVRYRIDEEGQLTDSRSKFLGSKRIQMKHCRVFGQDALLCITTRPWIMYSNKDIVRLNPLCASLDIASSISTQNIHREGILGWSNQTLKIYTFDGIDDMFSQTEMPLRYTPRQSTIVPTSKYMIIAEADHNALPHKDITPKESSKNIQSDDMDVENEGVISLPSSLYNEPKPGPGLWGSCIRLVDVRHMKTLDLIELENNECALSVTTVTFRDYSNEVFVCVGVAKDLILYPKRRCSHGYIYVYKFTDNGKRLEYIEKTEAHGIPSALASYQGRLLAGIGNSLVLYDLGKIKGDLVRKCENHSFPRNIVTISIYGERIIVGDIQESFHFVKYNRPNNSIHIIVDDTIPRWVTSSEALDYNTVAGSDKFGNVFILRVPDNIAHLDHDSSETRDLGFRTESFKLDNICSFYTGETVTKVRKGTLMQGCVEFLLYTTIHGMIGALIPLSSKDDASFLSNIELFMRKENPPLCGRDHLSYRSSFFTLKNVIDGDLCEQFGSMPQEKQSLIAEEIDRSVQDIQKKIESLRENI